MSLLLPLLRIIDIKARQDELQEKEARAIAPSPEVAGPGERRIIPERAPSPRSFRCRLCDHVSTSGAYCPRCLADTMRAAD